MSSAKKTDKAYKYEAEGDKLASKGKYKQALKKYQKALEYDPDRSSIYDKLVGIRDEIPDEWKVEDFVKSVSWTMKKQELEEPIMCQVHAKLSPEWQKASDLALKVLMAPEDDKDLPKLTEKLVSLGEMGTRVLIEIVRQSLRKDKGAEVSREPGAKGKSPKP